jgi:hypothetical protein
LEVAWQFVQLPDPRKIEITRVKLGDEVSFKGYEARAHGMAHEKAKKMGAHCTSYVSMYNLDVAGIPPYYPADMVLTSELLQSARQL